MRLRIILIATLLAPMACDAPPAKPTVSERGATPPVAPVAPEPELGAEEVLEPAPEPVVEDVVDEQPVDEVPAVVEQPQPEPEYRPANAGPIDNLGQGAGNDISDMDAPRGNSISEMDAPRGNSISEMDEGRGNAISEMDTPRGNSISEMSTQELPPIDGRDPITREPDAR